MNALDWAVVVAYLAAIVAVGAVLGRSQSTIRDYFLGGRSVPWWHAGTSAMATQLGAISFVSAPAFVALKEGGGLKWLAYEFGVPLALIVVMAVLVPVFYRANVVSIYEYLEQRFDVGTRTIVSLLFQVGRGLATAVSVLAGGLILSTALGISTPAAILLIGGVTVLYDVLGGIRVVILSDVVQMAIIAVGLLACGGAALALVGWEGAWTAFAPERRAVLDFSQWGLAPGGEYAFWPMLIGGFFLYASYYGCDQSQVQRELTVGSVEAARKAVLFNAVGRFPVVLLYCVMGVLVGAVVALPGFAQRAATVTGTDPEAALALLARDPDRMVPIFILGFLPHGLIGFILVAIMSALMSSLDSALNSMSAVTVRDFYQRWWRPQADARHYLIVSKVCTLFWGVFCVAFALLFALTPAATRQTTIVLINAIGSLLYGPILAAFLLGIATRWAGARAVKAGVLAGVAVNLALWQGTSISWLWWNATGFVAAVAVAALLSALERGQPGTVRLAPAEPARLPWRAVYVGVAGYFFLIVALARLIETSAS